MPIDLSSRGWDLSQPFDLCWLDCADQGYRKVWQGLEISLCPRHAAVLESGQYAGDYRGAPLPDDSLVPDWPWMEPLAA
jgi:hypothetical protein